MYFSAVFCRRSRASPEQSGPALLFAELFKAAVHIQNRDAMQSSCVSVQKKRKDKRNKREMEQMWRQFQAVERHVKMKAWFTCTGTLWESIRIGTSSEYFEEMPWFSSTGIVVLCVKTFQELQNQWEYWHTLAGTLSLTILWLSYTNNTMWANLDQKNLCLHVNHLQIIANSTYFWFLA